MTNIPINRLKYRRGHEISHKCYSGNNYYVKKNTECHSQWHTVFCLYSVGPRQVSSIHIYTFVVSRAFMAGAASQAGDADSSRAPGRTSGLQGSVNVHCGALLLVPQ